MGLLPLQRNTANMRELEEERRLLYVGITRAEENLYLSYAVQRRKYNQYQPMTPSLFLDELPDDLIEMKAVPTTSPEVTTRQRRSRKKKLESYFDTGDDHDSDEVGFKVGQPVYHATFGKGKVISIEGKGDKAKITVHFTTDDLMKKLIKQYANLSPLES